MHNLGYLFKQGVRSVFKNKMMSFACIGVLVACMLLIGAAVIFTVSINNMVTVVEQQNEIVAYMEEGTGAKERQEVENTLNGMQDVLSVKLVTKEEGLETLKLKDPASAVLLNNITDEDNPIPDKFIIRLKNPENIELLVGAVEDIEGIEKVDASVEVARLLAEIKNAVYYAGAAIIVILILVSLVIITNTVKITVFNRRREINIMKYVGATDGFIRFPFLVEGLLIGFLAAVIAFLFLGVGYSYLLNWTGQNYGQLFSMIASSAVPFKEVAWQLFAGFCGIGLLIGFLSSGIFVRKYLKV